MNTDLKHLHNAALKPIFQKSKHKRFLTQSEYLECQGYIDTIKLHTRNLNNTLKGNPIPTQ